MDSIQEFVARWKSERKAAKGKWFAFAHPVTDIGLVAIKGYDTWIQIVRAEAVPWRGEGPMDSTVKDAAAWLEKYLNDISAHVAKQAQV